MTDQIPPTPEEMQAAGAELITQQRNDAAALMREGLKPPNLNDGREHRATQLPLTGNAMEDAARMAVTTADLDAAATQAEAEMDEVEMRMDEDLAALFARMGEQIRSLNILLDVIQSKVEEIEDAR